ncbi:hypothetical protein Goari_013963 [Gossypium aridum]|uniref:Protein kinase domain-containing protein n=1 Tax=Gossypium aridum TaxID=34290 RepID=A0A7J8XGD3_GOSAI|nr:hypothetical protein [Gossypium aridum]
MIMRFALIFIFLVLLLTKVALASNSTAIPIAKPGCNDTCGQVRVPYPFGIGPDCYRDSWFEVLCNENLSPPTTLLKKINMEVLNFSYVPEYTSIEFVRVKSPVISKNCSRRETEQRVNLTGSPFSYSETRNKFVAAGCNNRALMAGINPTIVGCESDCINGDTLFGSPGPDKTCNSGTCCETVIPSDLKTFNATFERNEPEGCQLAFLVDQQWFDFSIENSSRLQNTEYVPALLDWSLPPEDYGTSNYSGRLYCRSGYRGNPYLPYGCHDIDECLEDKRRCGDDTCVNKPGHFVCEGSRTWIIALGLGLGFGILCLVVGGWLLYKFLKKRREVKLKEKFFKRNGGFLLQQQMFSHKGSLEKTKIFTSKELDKATDNFNKNRELGQGGQGTVYKGMLVDGRIVAVKKSKAMVAETVEEFINEVVILSQINHRNVVKLLGCCLETEVPLLVYEFIPNGTLFQYLHDQSEEFPLPWGTRLRIAKETAEAISYLHFSASIPIYHRDIKSTNILLDEKFKAKVSDFGTSRSISVDQTHLTTHVQGTFGYLDPEYFQSSQFTEKSDVYSFGVVLVELLTGEKPILSLKMADESRSLATHFIASMEENRVLEIIDGRVAKQAKVEELMMVAKLAYRCLSLSGKKRPTMKEVAMQLEQIMPLPKQNDSNVDHHHDREEINYLKLDLPFPLESSSLTDSSLFSGTSCSTEKEPLV